jgi:hypothetical protein
MSSENQAPQAATNMDTLKQQGEACGAGCCCHASAASGRTRWVLGGVILLVAAALVARAVLKGSSATTSTSQSAAATEFAAPVPAGVPVAATPAVVPAAPSATAVVGTEIAAFAELNALAAETTAVLVFVPGKSADETAPPTAQMEAAARTIAAQDNNKVALFTLKASGPDYEQIVGQVTVPGVLALVKGKGMKAVAGEITETKLVQAFVAAASAAGGCGSGSAGCAPGTPGCK